MLAILAFAMALLLPTAASAEPSRDDLGAAEEFALHLANGRIARAEPFLSAPLRERLGPEGLRGQQLRLEATFGSLRQVQAAYALADVGPTERAVVPVDYEKGGVDLVLSWRGELVAAALVDCSIRPRQPRPTPTAQRTAVALPFSDASYVDPNLFTEKTIRIAPTGRPETEGLLALPKETGNARVPVVILLPDIAMEGVDGEMGPNRILRDLALGLATRGIATLRMVPRPPASTVQETMLIDVETAISIVITTPKINPVEVHIVGFGSGGSFALGMLRPRAPIRGICIVAAPPRYDLAYHVERLKREGRLAGEDRTLMQGDLELFGSDSLSPTQLIAGRQVSYWKSAENLGERDVARFRGKILYLDPEFDYLEENQAAWAQLCLSPLRQYVALKGHNRLLMESKKQGHPEEYKMPGHVSLKALDLVEQFVRWSPGRSAGKEGPGTVRRR